MFADGKNEFLMLFSFCVNEQNEFLLEKKKTQETKINRFASG